MPTGGELGTEKYTGSEEEEQGSNELKLTIGVNEEPFMQKGEEEAETALTDCQNELQQRVEEVLANEGGCQEIVDTVKENLGDVDPYGLTADSLGILLRLPGLYNLYRLKQTCKSTNLAKAFEPLLITDEMREIAAKVGVTLQLKATYNKASFKEVELFFINRDGGGVKPVEIYTYFESKNIEEIHFDADVEDDSVKTEEKVMPCKPQISQTEVDMTGDGGGDKPVEDYTYFERKTIEEKDSDADVEDDSMKTEEKVTLCKHQASQTEIDMTGGKPTQLLLFEIDSKDEIQHSAERFAPLIFNSGTYTWWKGKHYDILQLPVKMTGQVQHVLSCRPEILALLGVRRYLVSDTDITDLTDTDLDEQIAASGCPILSRIDVTHSVSTQVKSLLLYDVSPKQNKMNDISYYLDLAQTEASLATKVLKRMLATSLNEKSKLQIQTLILQKELAETQGQKLIVENQNREITMAHEKAKVVAVKQLIELQSLWKNWPLKTRKKSVS
ncbi:uncharacterized protein [Ptychodera flava]|uniref:uncharacterized protein n=1 Tax=Ptychodera flava TaxID=63121 RepID=UPI00396A61A4